MEKVIASGSSITIPSSTRGFRITQVKDWVGSGTLSSSIRRAAAVDIVFHVPVVSKVTV